jgi:O-antigen/teichoic acid export membrane protein
MSRLKLFVENFFVYGFANIAGKIVPLIMLPVVTRLVPDTTIYGINDVLNVVASFASTFAVLGMYDAMFRLYFDKEDHLYRSTVCSSALAVVLRSGVVASVAIMILSKPLSRVFFNTDVYYPWLMLIGLQVLVSAVGSIVKAPTRIQNKRKIFVVVSVLNPVISYSVSIPLIIFVDPLFGLVFGAFSTSIADLFIFWILNKNWFKGKMNKKLAVDLMKFGLPLVPNLLVFWVFNSFDRIMISSILGPSYNGIYAVGARVAHISQLIYIAFAGGWQYFAFSTMHDKDYKEMMSKIWRILAAISFISWSLIYPFNELIFNLLFKGDYVNGSQVFPYLFLSPLLLMLYQIIGTQFQVIKKTHFSPICLSIGAGVNIILNLFLIPEFGIEGAALATLLGYTTSVILAASIACKKGLLIFQSKTIINILFFAFVMIFKRLTEPGLLVSLALSLAYILITLLTYKRDISEMLNRFLKRKSARKEGI